MLSVSNIILIFNTDLEAFSTIEGSPRDNDMVLLRNTLLNTCLSVHCVVTDASCISGVVLSNEAYKRSHETTFDRILDPLAAYNPNITLFEGAHCADIQKLAAKLINQSIIQATERGAHNSILYVVEDTWTQRCKNAETFDGVGRRVID